MSTTSVSAAASAVPSSTTVALLSKKSVSNGAICAVFRANGDPNSDWSATLYTAGMTPAQVQEWVTTEKAKCAALYDAHQQAGALLDAIQ